MTVQAMHANGFSLAAAETVQFANWLTDYNTTNPFYSDAERCALDKLHFDDVFDDAAVARYWYTLASNTRAAVTRAARDEDQVAFLVAVGISLHVVQDFYAHSNWVETHAARPGTYRTASWFDARVPRPHRTTTGFYPNCVVAARPADVPAHGGYAGVAPAALNKDSYVRPHWDRAFVYGYAASNEWIANVMDWTRAANPRFAASVLRFALDDAAHAELDRDRAVCIMLSEWVRKPGDLAHVDGHWNGNGTGDFGSFFLLYTAWNTSTRSFVARTFDQRKPFVALARGLYRRDVPLLRAPYRTLPLDRGATIVGLRVPRAAAAAPGGSARSLYGILQAHNAGYAGWGYRTAAQRFDGHTPLPWLTLLVVPRSVLTVDLSYRLWDQQRFGNGTAVAIAGASTTLRFGYDVKSGRLAGDLAGGPSSAAKPRTSSGTAGAGRAALSLYLFSAQLTP